MQSSASIEEKHLFLIFKISILFPIFITPSPLPFFGALPKVTKKSKRNLPETLSLCTTEKGLLCILKILDVSPLSKYMKFVVYSMEILVCTLKRLDLSPLSKFMEFGVYSMEKLVCTLKRLDLSHLSKYLEFGVYSMEKLVCTLKRLELESSV